MSTSVFPTLSGIGWPVTRSPIYKTRTQTNISGKEVRIADWSSPRYQWKLPFAFLRQGAGPFNGITFTEYSQLEGFFESMLGGWDSFQYQDVDDNKVTSQIFAQGDGSTISFQLKRSFGGGSCPILAPNLSQTFNVYLNGSPTSSYVVTHWGQTNPGVVTFSSPPGAGVNISADFSYYFPCRFDDDSISFDKFLSYVYECKSLTFTSIK